MYLTPARYASMGFGNDLSALTPVQLNSLMVRASAAVDSYCAVSQLPQNHDFRGGSMTGEQHEWQLPDLALIATPGSRRVYFNHGPIREVTSFKVMFTNTYMVTVDPSNLYVNAQYGWAEVVSIAAIVSGVYPVGINFGLYTPVAVVDYDYGWEFTATEEILPTTDNKVYQAANQFWLASPAPVIKKNGVIDATPTVNRTEGTVTYSSANSASDVITATYSYPLPAAIAEATGVIASDFISEQSLIAKGLGGVQSIKVAEVEISRERGLFGQRANQTVIPERAMSLLSPYLSMTVR